MSNPQIRSFSMNNLAPTLSDWGAGISVYVLDNYGGFRDSLVALNVDGTETVLTFKEARRLAYLLTKVSKGLPR